VESRSDFQGFPLPGGTETPAKSLPAVFSIFLMTGAAPRTEWLRGCLALDDKGFILTGRDLDTAGPQGSRQTGGSWYMVKSIPKPGPTFGFYRSKVTASHSRFCRLNSKRVGVSAHQPQRETPPGEYPAARKERRFTRLIRPQQLA
jgi:hypothetical protein